MSGESPSGESRVLLSITVEIEDGRVEHIELRKSDVPEQVSIKFCKDHNLPLQFVQPLTEHITYNLRSVRNNSSPSPSPKEAPAEAAAAAAAGGGGAAAAAAPQDQPKLSRFPSSPRRNTANFDRAVQKYVSIRKNIRTSQKFSPRLLQPTYTFSIKAVKSTRVNGGGSEKKEMASQKRKPELSDKMQAIYLRLYTDYVRQRQRIEEESRLVDEQYLERIEKDKPVQTQRSRKLMEAREREARLFPNYGELLYQEGMAKDQERRELVKKKQEEDVINELKGVTLKPEISKFAKRLKRIEGVWERLVHDKQNQEHLQELRNELWEAKLMECTFRPRINYVQSFERRDLQTSSRFEQLFYDAEHRRRRQAEYMQWHPEGVTFHPHINKTTSVGAGASSTSGSASHGPTPAPSGALPPEDKVSVFDRLLQYAERVTAKRQQLYSSSVRLVDPVTGQHFFHPATGRQPHFQRNAAALPIGDFLYQMRFAMENKKQTTVDRDQQERIELARSHYVIPKSVQLLDHLKERRMKQIFDHMDSKKEGVVDLETADTSLFTDEVMHELNMIKTMDPGTQLSYDAFVSLMQAAQRKLGVNGLHPSFRYKEPEEKFPFKVKMGRLSKSLAARRRKFTSQSQWYKIILLDMQQRLEKVDNLRKEKREQEMAECTFTPAIFSRHKKVHEPLSRSAYAANSPVVEKDKQEVHGFIFQDPHEAGGSEATGDIPKSPTGDETPKSPRGGDNSPKSPRGGDNSPKSPRGGDNSPKSPRGGDNSPKSPTGGDNLPKSPTGGGDTAKLQLPTVGDTPKSPRGDNNTPKSPTGDTPKSPSGETSKSPTEGPS